MSDKILVVSPTPSHPQTAGNRARIFSLLSKIETFGLEVHFLHVNMEQGDLKAMRACWSDNFYFFDYHPPSLRRKQISRNIRKRLKLQSAYTFLIDEWYDSKLDDFVSDILRKNSYKYVMVEYIFLSRVFDCFDESILKIIDTHDVFTDRHKRYLLQGERPTWYSTSSKEEAKALNRADVVLAIQRTEAEYFESISETKVITVGHVVEPSIIEEELVVPGRILLIGSNNKINIQAVNYFIQDVLPEIKRKLPDAELMIAGSVCDVLDINQAGVKCIGRIEDLAKVYQSANVVVNPMQFGTGLKIKSLEALSYAKPLVTTPTGAEGIEEGAGLAFLTALNETEYAKHIIQIIENPSIAKKLSINAYKFIKKNNQQVVNALKSVFEIRKNL